VGSSRRFLTRLGLVTLAAGAWRIWYVMAVANPRTPRPGLSDETFYHQQARLVADGLGFLNPFGYFAEVGTPAHRVFETAVHPPAYTVFLAIPARLGIDSVLSQRIVTALLGTATVFLIGMLGRRLAGDRAGIVAAVLAAASPALWSNDAVIGLETLYCFCLVVALLCLYRFWSTPSLRFVIGMAAALSVGALTRSEGLLLFVLLAVPTLLLVPGLGGRDRAKFLGVTALVGVIVMGPWVVRNLTTFDEPTVLGTGFGGVLAYGNCDATYSGELLGYWSDACSLKDYPPDLEESRVDLLAREQATEYIGDHLGRLPVVALARVGRVWDVFRPTQNVDFNARYERRGDAESWAVLVGYYVLLAFAIGGLVVMRRRRVPIFPMLAIAASVTITVALSFGITRYRAPVDVVLPVLAAVAIDAWWRRRERDHTTEAAPDVSDASAAPVPTGADA
jgi:4-amino-4-deoxy-L-arabinose transferase-like glycosyltransferase